MEDENRQGNFDLLRIISAFMVILIHVNAYSIQQENIIDLTKVEIFFDYISRFSVPCFLMISGAFILEKNETGSSIMFYRKALYQLVVPYLYINIFWVIFLFFSSTTEKQWIGYLGEILQGTYGNLWFVPMILMIYLLVPIIAEIKRSMSPNKFLVLGLGLLLWAIISNATSVYNLPYSIGVVFSFLSYFILGNAIYDFDLSKIKRYILILLLLLILLVYFTVYCRSVQYDTNSLNPYIAFFTPSVALLSIMVFVIFKVAIIRINLKTIAEKTYYIYLIHTPVYLFLYKLFKMLHLKYKSIYTIILVIVTFIISYVVSSFWKRIRELLNKKYNIKKKIVGL